MGWGMGIFIDCYDCKNTCSSKNLSSIFVFHRKLCMLCRSTTKCCGWYLYTHKYFTCIFIRICISSEPMYVSEVQRAGGGGEADSGRWVVTTVPPVVNIQSSKSSRQYEQYIRRASFKIKKIQDIHTDYRQVDRQIDRQADLLPRTAANTRYTTYKYNNTRQTFRLADRPFANIRCT